MLLILLMTPSMTLATGHLSQRAQKELTLDQTYHPDASASETALVQVRPESHLEPMRPAQVMQP